MGRHKLLNPEKRIVFMTELPVDDHNRLLQLSKETGLTKVAVIRHFLRNCTLVRHTRVIEEIEVVPHTTSATLALSVERTYDPK